jgi:hypothetical protein
MNKLLILGLHGGSLLMLIQILGVYTVGLWAVLRISWRIMLYPSSGLKSEDSSSMYLQNISNTANIHVM